MPEPLYVAIALFGALVLGILAYVLYEIANRNTSPSPSPSPSPPPSPPPSPGPQIIPRDYDRRIETWDDNWVFAGSDRGRVEFSVTKPNGLIVALSTTRHYTKAGYAVVLDQRGTAYEDPFDNNTSVSYVCRLPNINGPISNYAAARDVLLSNETPRHVVVDFEHGRIRVAMDGKTILEYRDPAPTTGVRYVGFGHLGVRSGTGQLLNVRVE
jgi:hypothetical protein